MVLGIASAGNSVFNLLPVTCGELLGDHNVQSAVSIIFVYQSLANVLSTFCVGEWLLCR